MRTLIIVAALTLAAYSANAQALRTSRGKEFYCMVMRYNGTPDSLGGFDGNHYIRVFLSSPYAATAIITVDSPAFQRTAYLVPNVVTSVSLPFEVEDTIPEAVTHQAIHIVADTDITAYVIYHKLYSTDSYMALPVTALGSDYTAVCYQTSWQQTAPEFGVVATEDATVVTITPTSSTFMGHQVGVPWSVTLNKGESYLVYGDPSDDYCDLTGTNVSSDKPIAMFSGHERTAIPGDSGRSRDCLVEQIPPNSTLGTSFITVPFAPRPFPLYDVFRIVAPVDSTTISINGAVVRSLSAGQFYEFQSSQATQIQTSNPVIVAQYSLSGTDSSGIYGGLSGYVPWDPAMMIIPPTQQFLDDYTFANSVDTAFSSSYVNVVIPDAAIGSLRLDGQPVTATFYPIPGSGYSYAQIQDEQGSHHITADKPFGIYVYGFGIADSYANTGGAGFKVLNGLLVTSNEIDYGNVSVDTCKDSVIVFHNAGQAPITVWTLWLADSAAGDFTILSGGPPFTLAPADSHVVHIKFCPSAIGFRGITNVRFTSNAAERPHITLKGRGVRVGVAADVLVLDYHQVLVGTWKDSLFTLRNSGGLTGVFDSLRITGANASEFVVQSPASSFSLAPGGSVTVTVRFTPAAEGVRTAMIQTVGPPGYGASVDLLGEGISPHIAGQPADVDFGVVKVDNSRDSLVVVKSVGLAPAGVGGYMITGPDSDQFALVSSGAGRVMPTGDTMLVGVRFTPRSEGIKNAVLAWHGPQDSTPHSAVTLHGRGAYAAVRIMPRVVDYGRVKSGKQRDSVLQTINVGEVDADMSGYALTGADAASFVIILTPPPATLAPGGAEPVTVRFAPQDTGRKHAQLIVFSDGRGADTIADLYGNARPATFHVTTATDTIRARLGDTISVPVRLIDPLDDADITRYSIAFGFDSTMLFPIGIHADSSWNASAFVPTLAYTPGVTSVNATSTSTLTGTGTLYWIDMVVLLGDATQTPLTFSAATYGDIAGDTDAVSTELRHGLFQLIGVCDTGEFLRVGHPVALSSVAPNPLNGDAVITVEHPATGSMRVSLVDLQGHEVALFNDGECAPGRFTAVLRGSALPSGVYNLVLQAGRFRETRHVIIAH